MADLIGYGMCFVSGVVVTVLVVLVHVAVREHREFAEQVARDAEWDRKHGIGSPDV